METGDSSTSLSTETTDFSSQSDNGGQTPRDGVAESRVSTLSVTDSDASHNWTHATEHVAEPGIYRSVQVEDDAYVSQRSQAFQGFEGFQVPLETVEEEAGVSRPYLLHEAIEKHDSQLLKTLLSQGVDLEVPNGAGCKPLYLAVARGFLGGVVSLLDAGADVESVNRLAPDFPTALQVAIDKNLGLIAELLILKGAHVDSVDLNGDTPLLNATKKRLPNMVQLLLKRGAEKTVVDRNGSTVAHLARGSTMISHLIRQPMILEGPPPLAQEQERVTRHFKPFNVSSLAPRHNRPKMVALHGFQATVVDFFVGEGYERRIEKSLSVYDLLYGMEEVIETPQSHVLEGKRRSFRWYHLPANNVEWVEDLIRSRILNSRSLSNEFKSTAGLSGSHARHKSTPSTYSSFMRPTCFPFNTSPNGREVLYDQIVAFTPYLHYETQTRVEQMADSINKASARNVPGHLSLSARSRLRQRQEHNLPDPKDPARWTAPDSVSLYSNLVKGYMTPSGPGEPSSLQTRRTLDQYYYAHLDTRERDKDQVVYRYTRDVLAKQDPKLFMVDQLWLWVLNKDTVISCAPASIDSLLRDDMATMTALNIDIRPPSPLGVRPSSPLPYHSKIPIVKAKMTQPPRQIIQEWFTRHTTATRTASERTGTEPPPPSPGHGDEHKDQRQLNVHHNIFRYLHQTVRAQIKSPYELASLITNQYANVFADHDVPADYQFFDFFERSIGNVSDEVANLLQLFQSAVVEGFESEEQEKRLNIQTEARLLVEIEDIHDELIILRMVLKEQQSVTDQLSKLLDPLGYDRNQQPRFYSRHLSVKENRLLKSHLQRIDTMEKMTQKTAKTLRSLLDLKQKQASIAQALASVSYAKQSAEQAEETARQGRTLTLFTVVTIVFLPLSFFAAFFAIEIDVFPVDESGKLSLDYVIKYLLGLSAGLSVPFILVAFNQDRFAGWIGRIRPRSKAPYIFLLLALLLAIVLIAIWTSKLADTVKVGVTVAVVLLGVFGLAGAGLYVIFAPMVKSVLSIVETTKGSIISGK